ncbi:MAG: uracil-DNA glycosylase [Gammaproteobacteria bacterium]|nr:uracil-DNA glycosylase [Gammaproteobacteria bacterium]
MTRLDNRQIGILRKMRIDLWQLREPPGSPDADLAAPGSNTRPEPVAGPGEDARPGGEAGVMEMAAISDQVSQCRKCPLHAGRIRTVPGTGSMQAEWMFVGEAPGQNEDEQGLPFVGRAGQLLDLMIAALKMRREQVFITNVLKCRPPGNRDPLSEEVVECEPYLHRQMKIIRPKIIVALGRISAQALLKTGAPLRQLRGSVHHYGEDRIPLVITYHPAYLLRSPQQKAGAWDDLLLARSIVKAKAH